MSERSWIIVGPRDAAELEKLGWVAGRDFLLSEPIPPAAPVGGREELSEEK